MRREFSAGGVVVRRMRGRAWVAATKPRRENSKREIWVLPKGQLEPGESGAEAAIREVYEETGLRTRLERKLGDTRYVYTASFPGGDGERIFKVVSFFLLRPIAGRLGDLPPGTEIEVEEVRWLALDEAPRLLAYGGERQMVQRALETIAGQPL